MKTINMKQTFAETFRTLRVKNKYTQNQVAEKLYVSDKTISKWETGKSVPDIDVLFDIAALFNVTIDYLVTGKASTETNKDMKIVYNDKGDVLHYVGIDGDRLFTRDEVTIILKKRIKKYEKYLLDLYGLKEMAELDTVVKRYMHLQDMATFPIEDEVKKKKEDKIVKNLITFMKEEKFGQDKAFSFISYLKENHNITNYQFDSLLDHFFKLTREEKQEIYKELAKKDKEKKNPEA